MIVTYLQDILMIQHKPTYEAILNVQANEFEALALKIFYYQATENKVYRQYLDLIHVNIADVNSVKAIPFLPIDFFKYHAILTENWQPETIFTSSGTTGQTPSQHYVKSLAFYLKNATMGFEQFYGKVEDYCILALLPSYLERSGSSLVAMADAFIKTSKYSQSGFFLDDYQRLIKVLKENEALKIPTLLLGVSFALLDLATDHPMKLHHTTVMETGGMKGRKREIVREELHDLLKNGFHNTNIHSEYGMTELLSQAYSKKDGIFYPATTMKVLIRDATDPFEILPNNRHGVINIVDLANVDSCSFIATEDVGRVFDDSSFEVLGRLDKSELRGCNLMINSSL
jgi:hypothetical protein